MNKSDSQWLLITGVSTAGKSYIGDCLPESMFYTPISDTTRHPRSHETNAIDYYFLNNEFPQRIANNEYLEHTLFVGNQYGLRKAEVDNAKGRIIAHVCDWDGLNNLHGTESSVRVFIDIAPKDIVRRMLARWMDNAKEDLKYLSARIHHALTVEMNWSGEVDIYYKDSDDFKNSIGNLVNKLLDKDIKYTPIQMDRQSKYTGITAADLHSYLLKCERPTRGEKHRLLTDSFYSYIEGTC